MENIILTGYMGSGKSTVGKNLSRIGGYAFVDTDEMIERQQGRTINDIFAQEGEAAFRDMETALLKQFIRDGERGLVIATGGGMPVREENRTLLRQLGAVFYLQAAPETIYNRLKGDTKRPLLRCADPLARIRQMLAERGPAYEAAAQYTIAVDWLRQAETAQRIADMVKDRKEERK